MVALELTAFATKWHNEATHQWQQMDSRLIDKTKVVRKQGAQSYKFTVFNRNNEAAAGKARGAPLVYNLIDTTGVTVTAVPYISSYSIEKLEEYFTDIDLRNTVTTKVIAEVRSAMDDVIISALNATSNIATLPSANTMNLAGTQKLAETLDLAEVGQANRYGVLRAGALTDLRTDANYTNNFHNSNRVVVDGVLDRASGIDLCQSQRLPNGAGGAGQRRCFAWNKESLGVFMPQDFTLTVDWVPHLYCYQVVGSVLMAAAIIDPKGVVAGDVAN